MTKRRPIKIRTGMPVHLGHCKKCNLQTNIVQAAGAWRCSRCGKLEEPLT